MNSSSVIKQGFICRRCGKQVFSKKRPSKAHKKGLCISKCDGIKRDGGGFPLDPELRKKELEAQRLRRKEKKIKKEIDKTTTLTMALSPGDRRLIERKKLELKNLNKVNFYKTEVWLDLRARVLAKHRLSRGMICLLCGCSGRELHVDHIKPRSKYPHLELEESNLQVLCRDCNLGKSNKDETDWRPLWPY